MAIQITPQLSIHEAAKNGFDEIVETWLKKDAYIDSQDDLQNTPLHLAAKQGHTSIVKRLLARGANPCVKNQNEDTPLSLVVRQLKITEQHNQIVALLLQKDSTANHFTYPNSDDSLLHEASELKHTEIVRLLLMQGADPNAVSRGYTAWHVGCNECTPDIIATFLKHPNINPNIRRESDGQSVIQSIVSELARSISGKERYEKAEHPMGKEMYEERTYAHDQFSQYLRYFIFSGVTLNEGEIKQAFNEAFANSIPKHLYLQIEDLINDALSTKQLVEEDLSSRFPPIIAQHSKYFLLSPEAEREAFLQKADILCTDLTQKKSPLLRLSEEESDQIVRHHLLGQYNFPDLNHNRPAVGAKVHFSI